MSCILFEKLTHWYHSVRALTTTLTRGGSLLASADLNRRGGFWGKVGDLRPCTKGLECKRKEEWKDLYRNEACSETRGTLRSSWRTLLRM